MSTLKYLPKSTRSRHLRWLWLEQLESRRLLASDSTGGFDFKEFMWEGSPRVAIELLVTDRQGYPISQIEKGNTFKVQAWIHDFSPGTQAGEYAAYTDVVFDASLVSAFGNIDHRTIFGEGQTGEITPGLLDEVGGFRDLEHGPSLSTGSGVTGVPLFEVIMTADSIGQVIFSANPADDLPAHEIVLVAKTLTIATSVTDEREHQLQFSSIPPDFVPPSGTLVSDEEDPVVDEDVFYSEISLEIVEPGSLADAPNQNPLNPFDTNADGKLSPVDLLGVLTELRCQHSPDASGCDETRSVYNDVNGDGEMTRHDVVHYLNYDVVQPFADADFYVARIGQPLAISAADGVLRNDFFPEGAVVTVSLIQGPDGLTLAEDGSFVWTPPEGFDDDQVEFTYSASYGKRSVNAKAQIFIRDIDDEQVIVSLRTVDSAGEPITEAVPGDTFFVEAYVEDTRPRPEGVFAAYIDVAFDSNLATAAGPFNFGSDFPNAHHGSAISGLLDEVGGLQQFDDYHVGGGTLLFSIPMTAESEGELILAPDMADTFPDHYMLLLGMDQHILAEVIQFNSVSLKIIDKNRAPIAEADRYFGQPGATISVPVGGGLVANDRDLDRDVLSVRLVDGPAHGTLAIEANGAFSYTPATDFTGRDTFTYVASDGELDSQITTVTIDVRSANDAVVAFRLQVLNDEGQLVDQVTVGDEFEIRVVVEDLRELSLGVFAAYLDVLYDASFVSTVGGVTFGDTYNAGREATHSPGLIDEAGAFTRSVRPVGGGEFLLFRQRFTATTAGQVLFTSNPADVLPAHDVLVYGLNAEVDPEDIDFGSAVFVNVPSAEIAFSSFSLQVVAEGEQSLGVADAIAVDYEVAGQSLDVLANDSITVSHITAVSGAIGSANIAADGKSIVYSAPTDFAGHDRFTYTIIDAVGATEVVTIDVQVKSPFQNFAHPTDTDFDGHVAPIDALYGVNELNRHGSRRLTDADAIGVGLSFFLDVNGDHYLAPLDVLIIINELNARSAANAEGEFARLFSTVERNSENYDHEEVHDETARDRSVVLPDFVGEQNTADKQRWPSFERRSSPSELFFARYAIDVEPLLEDDRFELDP